MATPKNVYELAQERLELIFREFDTICVSFSGGKDSGVLLNLCIDYIRRNNLKQKLCVFHMDYEIQYTVTIDYVDRILEANKDILEVYRVWCARCLPIPIPKKLFLFIRRICGITNIRCTLPNGCICGKMRYAPAFL